MVGGTNLPPPPTIQMSVKFRDFADPYGFTTVSNITLKLGNITNFKMLFSLVSIDFR